MNINVFIDKSTPLEFSNKLKDRYINTIENCSYALNRLLQSIDGSASKKNLEKISIINDHHPTLLNKFDERGYTSVHIVCLSTPSMSLSSLDKDYKKNTKLLRHIIKMGGNINLQTKTILQNYPIHLSCMNQNYDMVRCLIEHGANTNALNVNEQTPIFFSLLNPPILKLLLLNKADKHHKDNNGHTALDIWNNNLSRYGDKYLESKKLLL